MAAAHFRLANLTAIIDHNSMQSDGRTGEILDVDLVRMWQGLGWEVARAAGHDVASLYEAFSAPRRAAGPRVLIAATVKGKGVSFMENNNEWHHNRLTREQYEAALAELPRDQAQ
jgi:transketolase